MDLNVQTKQAGNMRSVSLLWVSYKEVQVLSLSEQGYTDKLNSRQDEDIFLQHPGRQVVHVLSCALQHKPNEIITK